jgi:hypothetical protein
MHFVLNICASTYLTRFPYAKGLLNLKGHTVVLSLTFSTVLVIKLSFLITGPEGSDRRGDDTKASIVSSGTPFSWN